MFKALLFMSPALLASSMMPITDQQGQNQTAPKLKEGDVAPGTQLFFGRFGYTCEFPYYYIPYDYAVSTKDNSQLVCDQLANGKIYRLEGGGSVEKDNNGACTFNRNSTKRVDGTLCARWDPQTVTIVDAETCPENTAFIAGGDLYGYSATVKVCEVMKPGEVVSVGYHGYMNKDQEYSCKYQVYSPSLPKKRACVNPFFKEIIISPVGAENPCPEGQSLLTLDEFQANFMAYCQYVPLDEPYPRQTFPARLAGGAVIFKNLISGECSLQAIHWYGSDKGLCADENRKLVV